MVMFWSILAIAVIAFVPIMLLWTMIDYFRGKGSDRRGSGGITTGVAAAMMELDRLVARPSVEHQVETENQTLRREDDTGGE